ncbi:MAG: hypothetical protein J0H08_02640 [Rhizobiales bacterium]|nr:hypothetical protein [Hyphomicrobiales bacterium]
MSAPETRGVAALAALLRALAEGRAPGVAEFAATAGIARSTGFAIAQKAERAGFVGRGADAALRLGPELVRLAYAAHGVGPLHGPALPLCAGLRDETGWGTRLWSSGTPRVLLLSLPAPGPEADAESLSLQIGAPPRAWLTLYRPPGRDALPREGALRSLREAAAALEAHLDVLTPIPPEHR